MKVNICCTLDKEFLSSKGIEKIVKKYLTIKLNISLLVKQLTFATKQLEKSLQL